MEFVYKYLVNCIYGPIGKKYSLALDFFNLGALDFQLGIFSFELLVWDLKLRVLGSLAANF